MDAYIEPIKTACWLFPLLAAALTIPFALYQYHKYGSLPWLRSLVVFSFIFYMLAAYFLIILPLPDRSNPSIFSLANHFEPVPFNNLTGYVEKYGVPTSLSAVLTFIKSGTFLTLAFNILMTIPFGVYLRYYFKCGFKKTLLFSFLLTTFYEVTQITGLYGIYPAPYRTFDADDFICNTLGGCIGWLIAPALLFFLPKRDKLDESARRKSGKVTLFRRICATFVDYFIAGCILAAAEIIRVVFFPNVLPLDAVTMLAGSLFFFVFQWICALISHGFTPGKSICHTRVVGPDGKPAGAGRLSLRYGIVAMQLVGVWPIAGELFNLSSSLHNVISIVCILAGLACVAAGLLFYAEFAVRIFGRHKLFYYERLSGTQIVSVYAAQADAAKAPGDAPAEKAADKI